MVLDGVEGFSLRVDHRHHGRVGSERDDWCEGVHLRVSKRNITFTVSTLSHYYFTVSRLRVRTRAPACVWACAWVWAYAREGACAWVRVCACLGGGETNRKRQVSRRKGERAKQLDGPDGNQPTMRRTPNLNLALTAAIFLSGQIGEHNR